MTGLID